jgi:hypothetical protein
MCVEKGFDIFAAIINMRDAIIREVKKETEKTEDLLHEGAREMKDMIHKEK